MPTLAHSPLALLATALALPAAAQTTWIVDDDPGPGVDFTDLPPAVAAAGPFDTIVVRDGSYSSTTVTRGMRIVGEGTSASWIFWDLGVQGVPANELLVIAGLRIADGVTVASCDGAVILEDVYADSLVVDASHDVRLQRFTAWNPGFGDENRIVGSRVELVDSLVRGRTGWDGSCQIGDDGELGLRVVASFVHAATTEVRGGAGGYCNEQVLGCCPQTAAAGGPALDALDSQVVLSGAVFGDGVFGGDGGETWRIWGSPECPCGPDGPGLIADGAPTSQPSLRLSDVAVTGNPPQTIAGTVAVTQTSGDPVLRLAAPVVAGSPLPLEIHGDPGLRVQLEFGRSAIRAPVSGSPVEQLTSAERRAPLGNVPVSGVMTLALNVPATWPTGTVFFLQCRQTDPTTGAVRMSNSAPFVVR